VHVVDSPPFMSSHCKDQSHRFHAGNQHEHIFKVDSLLLQIAFRHELCFMLDDAPVLIPLCFVNPFEANGSVIAWKINRNLSSILLNRAQLFHHSGVPAWIMRNLFK
jgi:hypothetical protein